MQVPQLILDTLDELCANDFKRFLWNLTQPVLDGCQPLRKGHLENADRQDTMGKMIDSYGEESAVNITIQILKRINHNNAAEKLKKAYAASSSSGVAPPASSSVCAQGGSVIVAPHIDGSSAGVSINMNINTQ
eukprot:superscaffoldBa00001520_g10932